MCSLNHNTSNLITLLGINELFVAFCERFNYTSDSLDRLVVAALFFYYKKDWNNPNLFVSQSAIPWHKYYIFRITLNLKLQYNVYINDTATANAIIIR